MIKEILNFFSTVPGHQRFVIDQNGTVVFSSDLLSESQVVDELLNRSSDGKDIGSVKDLLIDGKSFLLHNSVTDNEGNEYYLFLEEKKDEIHIKLKDEALKAGDTGVFMINLAKNEIKGDQIFAQLFGLKENNIHDLKDVINKLHVEDQELFLDYIRKDNEYEFQNELELRLKASIDVQYISVRGSTEHSKKNHVFKGTCQDISLRKKVELEQIESIIQAQEMERERIGKEIHDGLAQYLTAAKMNINALSMVAVDSQNGQIQYIEKAKKLLSEAADEARNISHRLVPGLIYKNGLVKSIDNLIGTIKMGESVVISFDSEVDSGKRFPSVIELNYYRITQELLSNALKHSGATKIWVNLIEGKDALTLNVSDNGIGLIVQEESTGLGLNNVQSRISFLQGSIDIETKKNRGTSVTVTCIPGLIENSLS